MKHLDFLSTFPRIYLLKEKRGKNKLGVFFSLFFILLMLTLSIYYIYVYSYGLEYDLKYYRDNWRTSIDEELKPSYLNKPRSFILEIKNNPNNAVILPALFNYNNELNPAEKCYYEGFTGDTYCFDLVFDEVYRGSKEANNTLYIFCLANCTDQDGTPAHLEMIFYTSNFQIDHSKEIPIMEPEYWKYVGYKANLEVNNNILIAKYMYFRPIFYNSTEILNAEEKSYISTYFDSVRDTIINSQWGPFAALVLEMTVDCDVYIRKYTTLLDTLSKIGGLFSPFKLLFEILIFFYSDLEINSEITKNVFAKIKHYEYKSNNKISIDKKLDNNNIIILNEDNEKKMFRKKFNVNKCEQYFCSFFNCCKCCNFCKTHRTMKILNLCSDFVQTYLSAENIIFNMILFENFYKDNPIKFTENSYLNKIDKDIESENIIKEEKENAEEKKEIKEEGESLIPVNSID